MDFIERWFGIAPDGGDGTLEVLWVVAIVGAVTALIGHRWIAAKLSRFRRRSG